MGIFGSIGKAITKVLDVAAVSVAHPIQTATALISKDKTFKEVSTAHFAQSKGEQVKDIVLSTLGTAAAVAGGAAVAGAARAGTLLPALIPATTKGKIIAAVAAPIVAGAVVSQPTKTAETIIKAPSELAEFGAGVGNLVAQPSVESAKKLFEESPILTTLTGAALVGGAVKTILPAIATARQTAAINEQTEAIREGTSKLLPTESGIIGSTKPITPPTETISAGVKRKPSKKRLKAPQSPNISQRVNVIVSNKSSSIGLRQNKKYINREVLLN